MNCAFVMVPVGLVPVAGVLLTGVVLTGVVVAGTLGTGGPATHVGSVDVVLTYPCETKLPLASLSHWVVARTAPAMYSPLTAHDRVSAPPLATAPIREAAEVGALRTFRGPPAV